VLDHLIREELTEFTIRALHVKLPRGRFATADDVTAAVSVLEDIPLVKSAGLDGGAALRGFGGGTGGVCCGQIQDRGVGGGTAADDAKALVFVEDLGPVGPFDAEADPGSANGTRLSRRGTQQRPADSATTPPGRMARCDLRPAAQQPAWASTTVNDRAIGSSSWAGHELWCERTMGT